MPSLALNSILHKAVEGISRYDHRTLKGAVIATPKGTPIVLSKAVSWVQDAGFGFKFLYTNLRESPERTEQGRKSRNHYSCSSRASVFASRCEQSPHCTKCSESSARFFVR